ncbi:hypothetical protein OAV62_02335, partial [bacterium]|nr:hypothetical protein [bacterium]
MPTNYNGYVVPVDADVADAPKAFEEFTDSIPFSDFVQVVEVSSATRTVEDADNGKMLFIKTDSTLTFGTLSDGFSAAVVADTGVTVTFSGVDQEGATTSEFEVATVVTVNGTNILTLPGDAGDCPDCPECPEPELPGIGGWADVTAITGTGTKYEYTADGMDWSCFEWYGYTIKNAAQTGTVTTSGGIVDCLIVASGVAHNYAACAPVTDAELVFPAGLLDLSMGYATPSGAEGPYTDTRITPDGATDLQRQIIFNSGYTAYFDGNQGRDPNGEYSSITGTEVLYGHCPDSWPGGANPPGWGGTNGNNTPGAVIIRVP